MALAMLGSVRHVHGNSSLDAACCTARVCTGRHLTNCRVYAYIPQQGDASGATAVETAAVMDVDVGAAAPAEEMVCGRDCWLPWRHGTARTFVS